MTLRKGFTFVEVLVSLALVSFLAAGLAGMIVQAVTAKGRADQNFAMTALAVDKLESFKALPLEDESLKEGAYQDVGQAGICPVRFHRTWNIEDLEDGSKRIELSVAPDRASTKTFRAVLFLSPELGFRP
jgi:prepilin-type N-terminal cleavage/methylation domain-containing protein